MVAVDWKQLAHVQGPATRVPAQLKQLVGKAQEKRIDAFDKLRDVLVGAEAWYSASAPAVSWLLEALPRAPQPELVLTLIAEIVGGDHLRGWLASPDAAVTAAAAPSVAAATSGADQLVAALGASSAESRAAAALVLAMLPMLSEVSLPHLLEQAHDDPDEVARASALLALGRLGTRDARAVEAMVAARSAEQLLVRGAGAVAWLRLDAGHAVSEVSGELRAWLTWEPPTSGLSKGWLPWFGGLGVLWYTVHQPLDATAHGLAALVRQRDERAEVAALCVDFARDDNLGVEARRIGALVLELGGFLSRPRAEVAVFEALTPEQQAIARGLAATTLLPDAGHGIVACGAARRRWAGVESSGPLEQPVAISEGEPPVPLWRAFVSLRKRGPVGPRPLPPALDELLEGCDRWQAIAELSARTYFVGCQIYTELFEEELARIPRDEALLARAASVADDLAQRYAAAARDELQTFPSLGISAWVLLPLARAGRALEPRWDPLLELRPEPLGRELFEALPAERRARAIQAHLARVVPPFALRSLIEGVVPLADLSPTRETAAAILSAIERYGEQPASEADALLEAFEAHGREHAALGRAIAAARAAHA